MKIRDHKKLAAYLKRDQVRSMKQFNNAPAGKMKRAIRKTMLFNVQLRGVLEDFMFMEHPAASMQIYFGVGIVK